MDVNGGLLDALQKLGSTFAFIVGGVWVLMNYVRNRTHVPRLQVEVKAELVERDAQCWLLASCQARNVGLSIIRLPQPEPGGVGLPGTALTVRRLPEFGAETPMIEAPWEIDATVFEFFANHQFIEPGLAISEQKLIHFPGPPYDACWVQLRVSAHGEKWSAVAVAVPGSDPGKLV